MATMWLSAEAPPTVRRLCTLTLALSIAAVLTFDAAEVTAALSFDTVPGVTAHFGTPTTTLTDLGTPSPSTGPQVRPQ